MGYLRSLRRLGRRPNTERAYTFELLDFGEWLIESHVQGLPELSRTHIEAWQDQLQLRKKPRTQQVAATALRGLLKWAADQELQLSSPTVWLRVVNPRVPPVKPRPIPGHDLALIKEALDPTEPLSIWRLRTRALFWVIFSSGARISEALSLTRGSIKDGTATVIQKGGRPHDLVISVLAQRALADYEEWRPDLGQALFTSLELRRFGAPLGKKEAQNGWDLLCKDLGIERFTSHQIRHSCASSLRRQGVDIVLIAKHMGHRNLQTIQGYTEVEVDERRRAVSLLDGPPAA
jgi:site-specific recombinase XerD